MKVTVSTYDNGWHRQEVQMKPVCCNICHVGPHLLEGGVFNNEGNPSPLEAPEVTYKLTCLNGALESWFGACPCGNEEFDYLEESRPMTYNDDGSVTEDVICRRCGIVVSYDYKWAISKEGQDDRIVGHDDEESIEDLLEDDIACEYITSATLTVPVKINRRLNSYWFTPASDRPH